MVAGRPSRWVAWVVALWATAAAAIPFPAARADEAAPAPPGKVVAGDPARPPAPGDASAPVRTPTEGSRPGDAPAARRKYARALFFDLRGRGPTPAEMDAALKVEPVELVDRMLADPAVWEAWLDRELYYYLLIDRFRPVSDRVKALPARLAFGACTVKDATREIVVSVEFNTRNPGNDTFVTVVLEQLLGMVVQQKPRVLEAGKKIYDGKTERFLGQVGKNQSDILRIVLEQKEFADHFIARQYAQVFGAPIPKEFLAMEGPRFQADPACFVTMLREWVLSEPYRARTRIPRPKNDLVFIRTLFVDLLGREPSFDEFRNSRNALLALSDPAPVRAVIAGLILDSDRALLPAKAGLTQPETWVRKEFLDLLGREPTEKEKETFVATLGEYGCEPRILVLALATSPEYQYY